MFKLDMQGFHPDTTAILIYFIVSVDEAIVLKDYSVMYFGKNLLAKMKDTDDPYQLCSRKGTEMKFESSFKTEEELLNHVNSWNVDDLATMKYESE